MENVRIGARLPLSDDAALAACAGQLSRRDNPMSLALASAYSGANGS